MKEQEHVKVPTPESYRGISKKTLDFFGVVFTEHSSYWRFGDTWTERSLEGKRYTFHKEEGSKLAPFGMNKFVQGSAKAITICEGAIDAASAYEMQGGFPCVGVRSVATAKNEIAEHQKYFDSFERIYVCFDNDTPGKEAAQKVATLFDPKKVFIVELSKHNDCNDYLVNGDTKAWKAEWWSAKKHLPKGIISGESVPEILKKKDSEVIGSYPFSKMQEMTFGIRQGEFILFTAPEKIGKALSIDTRLPTPTGWTTVGELKVGDKLYGRNGAPTTVTYITPLQFNPMYKITFQDGSSVKCDGVHRWTVRFLNGKETLVDTNYMVKQGCVDEGSKAKFMIPCVKPVVNEEKVLPIDPFILGTWLADGHSYSAYITLSKQKLAKMKDYKVRSIYEYEDRCPNYMFEELTHKQLSSLSLIKNKHIPFLYLSSSIEQRQALMNGMMFDGWKNEFYTSREELRDGFLELARSLGYTCKVRDRDGHYTIRWKMKDYKAIRSITPIDPVPSKCLSVDSPDHLFVCGEGWNLTHNTEMFRVIEHHLLKTTSHNLGIIHLEEGVKRAIQGFVTYELGTPVHLPNSNIPVEEQISVYSKIDPNNSRICYYPHFGTDDPDIILQVIRYMVTSLECKFIFLDHITMLVTGAEGDDERRKLDYIATQLAMLTRDLGFTLFIISHVNDEGQTRGSRLIGKVCDLRVNLSRDKVSANAEVRNTMKVVISDNRFSGITGPCDDLYFDPKTYKLGEASTSAPF